MVVVEEVYKIEDPKVLHADALVAVSCRVRTRPSCRIEE